MTSGVETLDVIEPWLIATMEDVLITSPNPDLVNYIVNSQTTEAVTVPTPYLLITLTSSRDILGIGGIRIDTDSIYAVKVIHQVNSFVPGRAVMRVVDGALHGAIVTTSNGSLTCVRENMFHYPETIDGAQYMHVGANYRFRASS